MRTRFDDSLVPQRRRMSTRMTRMDEDVWQGQGQETKEKTRTRDNKEGGQGTTTTLGKEQG